MESKTALKTISGDWTRVLSQPKLRATHDKYVALKGDEHEGCGHEGDHDHHDCSHDHHDAVDTVLHDLQELSGDKSYHDLRSGIGLAQQAINMQSEQKELTPENAQTLYFLQQFVKTQIKALQKSSVPGLKNEETQALVNDLTRKLAIIESVLRPEELERLSKKARVAQRRDDGEWKVFDGFRNWLDGTLTEEQTSILNSQQWNTATGSFRPDKIIGNFLEHFVEGHLSTKKDVAVTVGITYCVLDAINFMSSVTGAHQLFTDSAQNADKIRAESTSEPLNADPLADSDPLSGADPLQAFSQAPESQASIDARLDAQCVEKFDPEYPSLINYLVENHWSDSCHEVSQALQTLFEVKTVTPRSLQSAQEVWADFIFKADSLAAEQFANHHEAASKIIEFAAFYDNSLHWFLLAVGGVSGAKIVAELGAKDGYKKIGNNLKQKGQLIKERPWPLGTAAAAGALASLHSGMAQGDFINMGVLPPVLFGAMAGVITQRAIIHHGNNKKAMFNLHAGRSLSEDSYVPPTSLDNERRYALKVAGAVTAMYTAMITANNTGLINRQSPEWMQEAMNWAMAGKAYGGGSVSWAVFDRLDDVVYHIAFYEAGIGTGATATAGALGAYGLFKSAPKINKAWNKSLEAAKSKLKPMVLAAQINLASVNDNRDLETLDNRNRHHYQRNSKLSHPSDAAPMNTDCFIG